ncbi:hypothetical protein AY601_2855 [Pedobacter cryoconitis]|uniref:TauD/TfdA-like domain-containing protein n=1 Tax=Pedobacter cryoconitis TaxID=188932 RepID=A0A127VEI0_9SPHI|nr:TauD/TfdA family dioxygenase [Pedobacter cryoconitis]AMP99733.1 hypothetical protein AY601_2855 [Pedobacter cryoconitis]
MGNIIIERMSKGTQHINVVKPEGNSQLGLNDLLAYLEKEKSSITKLCLEDGGVLFRNFEIEGKEEFLSVKDVFKETSGFDYVDGNSPRTKLSASVYTSTEYPKEYSISLHNEMSYSNKWPHLIFFFCQTPAEEGGETPIVDSRYILSQLNPDIVRDFEKHGVKYTRYLSGAKGIGKSWMDTFETTEKEVLEKYCQENEIDFFWEGENIALSQNGLGIGTHPLTGEKIWFNQANQFHPSNLPQDIYKMLKIMHSKNRHRFPQYAFYGDGQEIPEAYLEEITRIQFESAIKFSWQKGDLLMLDNMLMAHGRMPFKGERKIYVSMC